MLEIRKGQTNFLMRWLIFGAIFTSFNLAQETATTSQCDVDDPYSCDTSKFEVCAFVGGVYRCQCPTGYGRLSDGRCLLINECEDSALNDCHSQAQCRDLNDGYTCQCKSGYADISPDRRSKPGRICKQKVNECSDRTRYGVDCDSNGICVNTQESYTCRCLPGFVDISADYNALPGRKCAEEINECASSSTNECSENAKCDDAKEGYTCTCFDGYIDASPNSTFYPGRVCHKPEQAVFSACSSSNDCDSNALCSDVFDTYKCQCKPGYTDISDDPYNYPGRKCQELINECASSTLNECSPYATCTDTKLGYICACKDGYLDVSSQYNDNAGTHCVDTSNECSATKFHSCDDNAYCVDLTDGYACQCNPGFKDWSSAANLDPGRVCTVKTSCPSQPTDLMFLVDGSGSIGSDTFSSEVLRFVQEFVELFDIGLTQTQVAMIQYSDKIQHEIDFKDYSSKTDLIQAISQVKYLSGMTQTGRAITHMHQEGFSITRGARVRSNSVKRIAIVITDGRSQDRVKQAADRARKRGIKIFAIGVTDHVYDKQLEEIAGTKSRVFKVRQFKELDVRLRSIIQKEACPSTPATPPPSETCNTKTHEGCNRAYGEICVKRRGKYLCVCPDGFLRNPATGGCGGSHCNPLLPTSCPWPAECNKTPYGDYRCACPEGYFRHPQTGFCVSDPVIRPGDCFPDRPNDCPDNEVCAREANGRTRCVCSGVLERNEKTGKCMIPGSCDPTEINPCEIRKKEECLIHSSGRYYTCQCPKSYRRHSQTGVCLINECLVPGLNDCHAAATCTDTDDSYLCQCPSDDYIDTSDDLTKPGRSCTRKVNECNLGTHNCSINAKCIDRDFGFLCQCKSNYVDFSPNPRQFAGVVCKELVDECALGQDNCHENADCLDTLESYICVCKPGFVDLNFLRNPGRLCVQNECDAGSHDCSPHAQCIDTEGSYTCRCRDGYYDTNTANPGRDCIFIVNECRVSSMNDCSPNAVCTDKIDGYDCKCKAGFIDKSPNKSKYPGRVCRSNQCSSDRYNDCSENADCEDIGDTYLCTCKSGYTDFTTSAVNSGRICLPDECSLGSHDCDENADCIDQRSGYTCRCKTGYHDMRPSFPGRSCSKVENECALSSTNDCDSNALCIDLLIGYTCECNTGFKDTSPSRSKPGRSCEPNFCSSRSFHDCSPYATCKNTDCCYTCECNDGYTDVEPTNPGRYCVLATTTSSTTTTTTTSASTTPANSIYCNGKYCLKDLGEDCYEGKYCDCITGKKRAKEGEKCEDVDKIVLPLWVIRRNQTILYYNSEYANPQNARYIEVVDIFNRGIGNAIGMTRLGKYYVTAETNYITQPRVYNSSWDTGLIFNFTVYTKKGTVKPKDLWDNLYGSIVRTNYSVGNTELYIDRNQPDIFTPEPEGQSCAEDLVCNSDLGEVCIANQVCGCKSGYGRKSADDECIRVEGFVLPLWVIKYYTEDLEYNTSFSSPFTLLYKTYVNRFKGGVEEAYGPTTIWEDFVYSEVNDIQDPKDVNSTWNYGILYNFTVYFRKGQIEYPKDVWTKLIRQIENNGYEIGNSGLIISDYQQNPFSPCYKSDCDPYAWCIPIGVQTYKCICPPEYQDMEPSNPGRVCRNKYTYNYCLNDEDNDCDKEHARCVDMPYLYRCICDSGYTDASPEGSISGSICVLDYCADLRTTCESNNATCVNLHNRGKCVCKDGYTDIRASPVLEQFGLTNAICIKNPNYCDLQLTNCSADAICENLEVGYTCYCPPGFTDGNLNMPGRVCIKIPRAQCGKCNFHGECIYDEWGNVTCKCEDGYEGPYCDKTPIPVAGTILHTGLPIILAVLFFLLMLGCLLFLCRYCRCIKGGKRGAQGTAMGIIGGGGGAAGGGMSTTDDSNYYKQMTIPRPRFMRPDYDAYSVSGSSDSGSDYGSEMDRRVVTEVKKTTITRTLQGGEAASALTTASAQGGSAQTTEAVVMRSVGGSGAAASAASGAKTMKMFGVESEGGAARQSGVSYTHDRGMSEYIESDYDDVDDEDSRSTQTSEAGDSVYDKHVTVNKSRGWDPDPDGRGGTHKFRTEVSTKSASSLINK